MLPSPTCGATTETVGLFNCSVGVLANWLDAGLGGDWGTRLVPFKSMAELCCFLAPGHSQERHVLIPWEEWTAVLTDGPLGTDVGMLPSLAARELACAALRAVAVDPKSERLGAVILEVFDPAAGGEPLRCRRSISVADDGGRWVFGQFGTPYRFEDLSAYGRRRIRDRFTPPMLCEYLRALGVPLDVDLRLEESHVVERLR